MSPTDDLRPTFDVYARPFVPQGLQNVNEAPANIVSCEGVRWIDFSAYVQTFAGSSFLTANSAPTQPKNEVNGIGIAERNSPTSKGQIASSTSSDLADEEASSTRILSARNYHAYFRDALKQEAVALTKECSDHALYQVPIARSSANTDPRPSMYSLLVPGLREMTLRIEVGDIVQLRQLRFGKYGEVTHGSLIKDHNGNPVSTPRKNDTQHNGVVWSIDRLRETLTLRVDSLRERSMLFNVRFTIQSGRLGAMYRTVITAQESLNAKPEGQGWMRSMLFPENSDGYYQNTLNKRITDLELHDPLLNYEQLRAVNTVLNENYGLVPFIVSGPPGTGKTKTIVELALQLVQRKYKDNEPHLLICAPSDPAADTLVHRLSKHLKRSELLRINSPARSFPEVPDNIMPYCFVDDGMFSLPPFKELMRCSVIVTTCRDAEILLRARVSNRDLCTLEQKLHATVYDGESHVPARLHWTGLLMDEAAQATEPEALIPLSVVAPPDEHQMPEQQLPIFVMAGDQHQLGPRSASKASSMQTSLFERLLDRPFYREHPLARSRQIAGVMRPLTQEMLPILRPAFANLIRNYRSHPAVLCVSSSLFYNDTLEPEATEIDSLIHLPVWKGRQWPVLFAANTTADEMENDGGGWYNVGEAEKACRYARSFIQTGQVEQRDICIMSPFRAQVRILRKFARDAHFAMPAVNIGPLEAFQGLESRIVILCTTRTRDRFLDQDVAKGLGVIHEPKRFNVALTRAKEGLVVIGNPDVLGKDKNWQTFLVFCKRNDLHEPSPLGIPESEDEVVVSRLERQLVQRDQADAGMITDGARRLGFVEDPEQVLWSSGVAAEEALKREVEDQAVAD